MLLVLCVFCGPFPFHFHYISLHVGKGSWKAAAKHDKKSTRQAGPVQKGGEKRNNMKRSHPSGAEKRREIQKSRKLLKVTKSDYFPTVAAANSRSIDPQLAAGKTDTCLRGSLGRDGHINYYVIDLLKKGKLMEILF